MPSTTAMKLPFILARRFVAAETLGGALPVIRDLNGKGLHVTLDLLGEYVSESSVALAATDTYVDLVRTLAERREAEGMDATISVKLSLMGQKIDEGFALANLRRLLEAAQDADVFVRLDMEGSDITQSTLDLFEAVYPDFPDHVGPVLQAYLKRTGGDVARMCELNARVRLCKGAYGEPPALAYQNMDEIRARYEQHMRRLIAEARYPGIATHDDALIEATKEYVKAEGFGKEAFEFQMLYGMRPQTQQDLAREGYHLRVYVPYGTEWLPYYSRRLRERKENVYFVLNTLFKR
jgi:proline dehydrogenase